MGALLAAAMVFVGCMSNIIFLEVLIKEDPGSGNLITFTQFVFIAVEGFIFTSKFGTVKPHISKGNYLKMVLFYFTVNLLNNYAFNFNIPVPLHLIFRSGSLIVNMGMGVYILKKKYSLTKYISVLLVSFGLFLCMVISGKDINSTDPKGPPTTFHEDLFWWTVGLIILTIALILSSMLGIFQEILYGKFGKHPKEALYYSHLLPLPLFLILSKNIYEHFIIALNSEPVTVLKLFTIPKFFIYLLGNVLSQFVCISSVYALQSECSSLIVTLVLTLRKFTSLIFSVLYFKNSFTFYHWIGTFSVFMGTLSFFDIHEKIYEAKIAKVLGKKLK